MFDLCFERVKEVFVKVYFGLFKNLYILIDGEGYLELKYVKEFLLYGFLVYVGWYFFYVFYRFLILSFLMYVFFYYRFV